MHYQNNKLISRHTYITNGTNGEENKWKHKTEVYSMPINGVKEGIEYNFNLWSIRKKEKLLNPNHKYLMISINSTSDQSERKKNSLILIINILFIN